MNIEFYNPGCKDFFKKHASQEAVIKEKTKAAIIKENSTRMTKVKLASKERLNGQPIYEIRLNVGKIGSIRVAFTLFNDYKSQSLVKNFSILFKVFIIINN